MKGELQPRLVSHGVNEANIGKQPLRCREFSGSREERNRRERGWWGRNRKLVDEAQLCYHRRDGFVTTGRFEFAEMHDGVCA